MKQLSLSSGDGRRWRRAKAPAGVDQLTDGLQHLGPAVQVPENQPFHSKKLFDKRNRRSTFYSSRD